MAEDEMYLDNLREFIFEEDKIVTYKWLSRTLSVNVNQAKQMLYGFVQHEKGDENNSLSILYVVGGLMKTDEGSLIQKYLFAHEKDLEDIKQCYDQLTSLHIYSLQKSKLKDSNVLYMADYDLQKENLDCSNRWSNISCKSAVRRTAEVRNGNDDTDANIESTSNAFLERSNRDPPGLSNAGPAKSVQSTSTTRNTKSKSRTSMKKGDVASFFARQSSSKSESKESETRKDQTSEKNEQQSSEKGDTKTNDANQKQNGQTGHDAITKDNIKQEEQVEAKVKDDNNHKSTTSVHAEKEVENDEDRETKSKERGGVTVSGNKKSSPDQKENKTKKSQKQKQEKGIEKQTKGVKRNKSKNSPKDENDENDDENRRKRKKRRRVKDFSDSSSEEEHQVESSGEKLSGGSADSIPIPDQQPRQTMDTNTTAPQKVRRRKRVLKSKTYLNEEGYMVTEKVYESESTDGSDIEKEQPKVPDKVNETKATVKGTKPASKKKPANKATKQASLTSFFKRS